MASAFLRVVSHVPNGLFRLAWMSLCFCCSNSVLLLIPDDSAAAPKYQGNSDQAFVNIRSQLKNGEPFVALDLINSLPPKYRQQRDYHFLRGRAFQELKQNTKALSAYSIGLYLDPKHVKSYINRALVRGALRDMDGALEDLNMALVIEPKNSAALLNRGVTFASLNKPRQALNDFNRAIQINAQYAEAYLNRGVTEFHLKDLSSACRDWDKSYSLGLKDAKTWIDFYCRPPARRD